MTVHVRSIHTLLSSNSEASREARHFSGPSPFTACLLQLILLYSVFFLEVVLLHEVLVPGLNLLPEEVVHHGAGEGAYDGALHAQPGVDEVHGQLLRLGLVPEPVRHVGEHAQSAEDAGRQHRVLLGLAHQLVPPALHGEGDELPGGLAAVAAGHLADDAQWCAA